MAFPRRKVEDLKKPRTPKVRDALDYLSDFIQLKNQYPNRTADFYIKEIGISKVTFQKVMKEYKNLVQLVAGMDQKEFLAKQTLEMEEIKSKAITAFEESRILMVRDFVAGEEMLVCVEGPGNPKYLDVAQKAILNAAEMMGFDKNLKVDPQAVETAVRAVVVMLTMVITESPVPVEYKNAILAEFKKRLESMTEVQMINEAESKREEIIRSLTFGVEKDEN